jgi:hypothetical protein
MANQRVFVTTIACHRRRGQRAFPSFLVHPNVRDSFISDMVTRLYGTRANGQGHDWEAYEEVTEPAEQAEAAAASGNAVIIEVN